MSLFSSASSDLAAILADVGETLTIGSDSYACSASALMRQDVVVSDGIKSALVRSFTVNASDFDTPPAAQSLLTFGGKTYRVVDVREDGTALVLNCVERSGRRSEGV